MRGNRASARLGLWLAGALTGLLLFAAPAAATFHLMKIREVYPHGSASYVELQLLENGEYQVGGHHLVSYNANGTIADDFTLPSNGSATSRANSTILITGSGYAAAFPSGPSTDELDNSLNLSATGGAVCWVEGEPPDCVAWGDFTGPFPAHVPPLVVGNPVSPGGVTAGKALLRTIAPFCSTFLEGRDDSDDSATDFSEQNPNPRNNAASVAETRCIVPEAAIDTKPASPTKSTAASFTYHALGTVEHLECKLDEDDFVVCDSPPFEASGLEEGTHSFEVRAVTSQGTGLPASYTWTVDTQPPTTTIADHPANPSSGSVSFSYESNELSSTFECSLAQTGATDSFASCPSSGKSYAGLADGVYNFKVRATDRAGNLGSTAAYNWQVDNSLATVTSTPVSIVPPPVTIPQVAKPPATVSRGCRKGFVKKKVRGKRRCVRKRRCRRVKVVVKKHGKKVKRWRRICAKKHRRRHGKRGHGKRRHKKRRTHRG
jgi:hypothetical protein